jgi:hypothetical protein
MRCVLVSLLRLGAVLNDQQALVAVRVEGYVLRLTYLHFCAIRNATDRQRSAPTAASALCPKSKRMRGNECCGLDDRADGLLLRGGIGCSMFVLNPVLS